MTYDQLDRMILEAARGLLREAAEDASSEEPEAPKEKKKKSKKKKDKISVAGAYGGGGRFSLEVAMAKSRAIHEPRRLVKELGITTATGRNDLERTASVISQAVKNNKVMAEAFSMPKAKGVIDKKGRTVSGYEVGFSSGDLKYRDAVKYMWATLKAAESAGVLKLDNGVGFVHAELTNKPAFYAL